MRLATDHADWYASFDRDSGAGRTEDLGAWLESNPAPDDAELADLIDADGRFRIQRGLATPLERYLDATPGLGSMPIALDAAIEAALRWMCSSGQSEEEAIAALAGSYPELRTPITEAVKLNRGVWSTRWIIDQLGPSVVRQLPYDVGPLLDDGQPRYRLTEILGRGSCGEVCLGIDRQLSDQKHDALVAVKLFDARDAREDVRRRFMREAIRARRVDHPSVVKALERGELGDGILYIVYEYVRGKTLARWLREREGRVDPRDAARIIASVAQGVQAAHAAGLIHCDLHPTNVLIDENDNPHICDFGIAVLSDELAGSDASDTWGGRALGSLAFIPPEQYRLEERVLGAPADVYALGGLLHFLLTGDLPNGPTPEEIHALLDSGGAAATRIGAGAPDHLDRDLNAIRLRALHPDPAERQATPAALGEDLSAWIERRPIEWTHPSPLRRTSLFIRRRPVVFALSMVALAALVVGASAMSYTVGVVHTRRQGVMTWYSDFQQEQNDILRESDGAAVILPLWILDKFKLDKALGGDGEFPAIARAAELDTVERMVDSAYAQTTEPDPIILFLEMTEAYLMLVNIEYHPGVRDVITHNRAEWTKLVPKGSRILRQIDVLEAIAIAKEQYRSSKSGNGFDKDAVRRAERTILDALPMYDGWYENSDYHVLLIRALRSIYGPHLLKDALGYQIYCDKYFAMVPDTKKLPLAPTPDWDHYEEWKQIYGGSHADPSEPRVEP